MKNHIKIITIVTSLLLFCGIAPLSAATDLSCSGGEAFWIGSAVPVDPSLTVTYDAGNIDDALVSIGTDFDSSKDTLAFSDMLGITGNWNPTTGVLRLNGTTTPANYQAALRSVTFNTTAAFGTSRNIDFALGTAVPANPCGFVSDHFYEAIDAGGNITWTAAKAAAETLTLFGLQGYLITITCESENDYVKTKIQSDAWIGASDIGNLTRWRWVTGPEGLMVDIDTETGLRFWDGVETGAVYNGRYNNWNIGLQPDNIAGERYGEIYILDGTWNNLPDSAGIQSYIVEYGDMPGDDPAVKITDTKVMRLAAPGIIIIEKQTDLTARPRALSSKLTTAPTSLCPMVIRTTPVKSHPALTR
ncbi:hypothetical protein QUF90_05745 [Desulfococcaceae bacterium HSG9]|nr:hypothetical protein [Desulfococcaceae bacterium HSG9]